MTCTDFRHLNRTDASFATLTRAERGACFAHYRTCVGCRVWLELNADWDDPGLPDEAKAALIEKTREALLADVEDPEFLP